MEVGDVGENYVDVLVERLGAFEVEWADGGSADEAPLFIAYRVGEVAFECYVLHCDQPFDVFVFGDYWELLNLVLVENLLRLLKSYVLITCNDLLCHHVADFESWLGKAHVSPSSDSDELAATSNDWEALDMVLLHELEKLAYGGVGG